MLGFLAPLLKGVVGKAIVGNVANAVIGGIAANRQAKADRAQSLGDISEQYVRLREAAEKGGFNPLSVLRAGGSGMPNPTPALSSARFAAEALGAGVQTYFNGDQLRRDAERDALEKALMREELRQMQAQGKAVTSRMGFGYEIPQANNYSGVDNKPPGLVLGGIPISRNENTSDAQVASDRYGDLVESVWGLGALVGDIGQTVVDGVGNFYRYNFPSTEPFNPNRSKVRNGQRIRPQ